MTGKERVQKYMTEKESARKKLEVLIDNIGISELCRILAAIHVEEELKKRGEHADADWIREYHDLANAFKAIADRKNVTLKWKKR